MVGFVLPAGIPMMLKDSSTDFLLVGGKILQMALDKANKLSRFVICGAVSSYNQTGTAAGISVSLSPL